MATKKTTTARKPKRVMSPALAAFWANSASASVMADYAEGRAVTVIAGGKK